MKHPCVYIIASRKYGTLYIGVTSDLAKRAWQHKNDITQGFTSKYKVHTLVYLEQYEDMTEAILREKRLKKWRRFDKIKLIESQNPTWRDLYPDILE